MCVETTFSLADLPEVKLPPLEKTKKKLPEDELKQQWADILNKAESELLQKQNPLGVDFELLAKERATLEEKIVEHKAKLLGMSEAALAFFPEAELQKVWSTVLDKIHQNSKAFDYFDQFDLQEFFKSGFQLNQEHFPIETKIHSSRYGTSYYDEVERKAVIKREAPTVTSFLTEMTEGRVPDSLGVLLHEYTHWLQYGQQKSLSKLQKMSIFAPLLGYLKDRLFRSEKVWKIWRGGDELWETEAVAVGNLGKGGLFDIFLPIAGPDLTGRKSRTMLKGLLGVTKDSVKEEKIYETSSERVVITAILTQHLLAIGVSLKEVSRVLMHPGEWNGETYPDVERYIFQKVKELKGVEVTSLAQVQDLSLAYVISRKNELLKAQLIVLEELAKHVTAEKLPGDNTFLEDNPLDPKDIEIDQKLEKKRQALEDLFQVLSKQLHNFFVDADKIKNLSAESANYYFSLFFALKNIMAQINQKSFSLFLFNAGNITISKEEFVVYHQNLETLMKEAIVKFHYLNDVLTDDLAPEIDEGRYFVGFSLSAPPDVFSQQYLTTALSKFQTPQP